MHLFYEIGDSHPQNLEVHPYKVNTKPLSHERLYILIAILSHRRLSHRRLSC